MSSEFCCGLEEAAPIPPRAGQRGVLVGERCIVSESVNIGPSGVRKLANALRSSAARRRCMAGPEIGRDCCGDAFARVADNGDKRAGKLDQIAAWLEERSL